MHNVVPIPGVSWNSAGPFAGLVYSQALAAVFMQDPSVLNVVRDDVRSSNGDFSNNESATYVLTLDWGLGEHDLKSISAFLPSGKLDTKDIFPDGSAPGSSRSAVGEGSCPLRCCPLVL